MASVTKINRRVSLFIGKEGRILKGPSDSETGSNVWCFINEKGNNSNLNPIPVKRFFRSPARNRLALVAGDEVIPFTLTRVCKTEVSVSMTESETEVQDDCSPVISRQLTGISDLSGTMNGFFKYDSDTGKLVDFSRQLANQWFDFVEDPATGSYSYKPRSNSPQPIFLCWNSDAKKDQMQNWLALYANLNSTTFGGPNADVQSREISFTASDEAVPTFIESKINDDDQEIDDYEN